MRFAGGQLRPHVAEVAHQEAWGAFDEALDGPGARAAGFADGRGCLRWPVSLRLSEGRGEPIGEPPSSGGRSMSMRQRRRAAPGIREAGACRSTFACSRFTRDVMNTNRWALAPAAEPTACAVGEGG